MNGNVRGIEINPRFCVKFCIYLLLWFCKLTIFFQFIIYLISNFFHFQAPYTVWTVISVEMLSIAWTCWETLKLSHNLGAHWDFSKPFVPSWIQPTGDKVSTWLDILPFSPPEWFPGSYSFSSTLPEIFHLLSPLC